MRFWDSAAVVPLLIRQDTSERVDRWFGEDPTLAIWTLTPIEVTSALWRLAREGDLSEGVALEGEARAVELEAASHVVVDVEAVKLRARRLLRTHSLRAAGASQLGAALLWAADRPQGRVLHTLDDRLATAARREGFEVP